MWICWLIICVLLTSPLVCCSLGVLDSLPPELLETILGTLDVRHLCTARLVCTRFHVAASQFIHSITLSANHLRRHPETNLNSFPKLTRVMVVSDGKRKEDFAALTHPGVYNAVTHMDVKMYLHVHKKVLFVVPPLPNLVSMPVTMYGFDISLLQFPLTLRELDLDDVVTVLEAEPITHLTRLTSLRILSSLKRRGHLKHWQPSPRLNGWICGADGP
jgi:hypothetical protein